MIAARRGDPDAFAAAVKQLLTSPPELQRNSQRMAVALFTLAIEDAAGTAPVRDQLIRFAAELEVPLREFVRANRWDLEEVLLGVFVDSVAHLDFLRIALLGIAIVGAMTADDLHFTTLALSNKREYLEARRGTVLAMVARNLADEPGPPSADDPSVDPVESEPPVADIHRDEPPRLP